MLEDLYREAQQFLHSPYLTYALAGVFIVIWWIASRIVGALRRVRSAGTERPRRRLPLG